MLTRTVLSALAAAAVAAGGSSTVLVAGSGNEHGLAQRSPRAAEAQQAKTESTDDVQSTEVELPPCPADVKNHGAYVSSVAKTNRGHAEGEEEESEDTNHGALVSAAAQSDCGKPEGGDEDETVESAATKAEKDAAKAARKEAKTRGKSADAHATAPGQASSTP